MSTRFLDACGLHSAVICFTIIENGSHRKINASGSADAEEKRMQERLSEEQLANLAETLEIISQELMPEVPAYKKRREEDQ